MAFPTQEKLSKKKRITNLSTLKMVLKKKLEGYDMNDLG